MLTAIQTAARPTPTQAGDALLETLLQLQSLLLVAHGATGEAFRSHSEITQDGYLAACYALATQCQEPASGLYGLKVAGTNEAGDTLVAKLHHLQALLAIAHGESGEALRAHPGKTQDDYLGACSALVEECYAIVTRICEANTARGNAK